MFNLSVLDQKKIGKKKFKKKIIGLIFGKVNKGDEINKKI